MTLEGGPNILYVRPALEGLFNFACNRTRREGMGVASELTYSRNSVGKGP